MSKFNFNNQRVGSRNGSIQTLKTSQISDAYIDTYNNLDTQNFEFKQPPNISKKSIKFNLIGRS